MLAASRVGWYSLDALDLSLFGIPTMLYLNVILTVKDSNDIPEIQSLLSEQGRLSRAEPGCLRFEVYHSNNDPKVFILNEHWADQTAVDAHRKATAYTTIYQPKVLPKVDRVPHPADLVP